MGIGFRELFMLLVLLPIYFVPLIVAASRKHPQTVPISLLNLLTLVCLDRGGRLAVLDAAVTHQFLPTRQTPFHPQASRTS
jgi:hypothetical protein